MPMRLCIREYKLEKEGKKKNPSKHRDRLILLCLLALVLLCGNYCCPLVSLCLGVHVLTEPFGEQQASISMGLSYLISMC